MPRICNNCSQSISGKGHSKFQAGGMQWFFCPVKMNHAHGTSLEMTFDQFKETVHYEQFLEEMVAKREAEREKRAEQEKQENTLTIEH